MISPEDIRQRACKLWATGRALRGWLGAEPLFPYAIPFRKPSANEWLEHFPRLRTEVDRLEAGSKAVVGSGYTVIFRTAAHQKLGLLRIPDQITFANVEDVAACAGEDAALRRLQQLATALLSEEPRLAGWLAERPLHLLKHETAIPRLLAVVEYFRAHPRPMRFARELGIPGVDSKFVEAHQALLSEWLERLLPVGAMDASVRGLSDHGFERRFGLRHEEPLVRFRWLDPSHGLAGFITDLTIPLSQFCGYAPPCSRVFMTENKINFMTLPPASGALAIFGGGYAIDRLAKVWWLRDVAVSYWGDIDTHGFAILSRLRGFLPQTRSFLMDRETLFHHQDFWNEEPPERRCLRDLLSLSPEEYSLYDDLRNDRLGERVRLEQERIGYSYVKHAVQSAMQP